MGVFLETQIALGHNHMGVQIFWHSALSGEYIQFFGANNWQLLQHNPWYDLVGQVVVCCLDTFANGAIILLILGYIFNFRGIVHSDVHFFINFIHQSLKFTIAVYISVHKYCFVIIFKNVDGSV